MSVQGLRFKLVAMAAGLSLAAVAASANAQIPYPNAGTVNPQNYTLIATNTGNINVWFDGHGGAIDDDVITAIVNGVPTGIFGADNQSSTIGEYFNLGHVHAGDTVVLEMKNLSSGQNFFTVNSMNSDGDNHAYLAAFAGGLVGSSLVPASDYFGFEDVAANQGSDLNYLDDQIFAKSGIVSVPEPATWALMLIGAGMIGAGLRLVRRKDGAPLTA